MQYERLEEIRGELDKCVKCASCQAGCPTYGATLSETLAARGKIRLAQAVLDGRIGLSGRVGDDFAMCLSCINCSTACPLNIDTMKIFTAVRAQVTETKGLGFTQRFIHKHVLPYPKRLNALAKLVGAASLFYKSAPEFLARLLPFSQGGVPRVTPGFLTRNLRTRIKKMDLRGAAAEPPLKKIAYFSGCMTDLAYPDTGMNVMEKLKEAGVEVSFPEGQVCCGAPSYYAGDMETSRGLAKTNMDVFSAQDVDAIVVSCATCGSTLSHAYTQMFPGDDQAEKFAAKIIDFQKLMIELGVERLNRNHDGSSAKKLKVTYHDPCHLSRGMNTSAEPRALIKSLPSVEFVEMDNADMCCGGAGTFSLRYYDMATDMGKTKADAIIRTGADVVATSCPSCQLQLSDALNRSGSDIPVMHTADLMDLCLAGKGDE